MQPFAYSRATSFEAAVRTYAAAGEGARYLGGGTTLFDLMKLGIEHPRHVIDLTGIAGHDRIDTAGDRLRFGAMARMADVAAHPEILRDYPVLSEAMSRAASQQLRNMARVGGNLLQRTRCLYFRNGAGSISTVGAYPCNKRRPGSGCAAIGGLDRGQAVLGTNAACTAVSPGDWPVALTALDASVELLGPAGTRTAPIADFYVHDETTPDRDVAIEAGEIVVAILVPKTRSGRASTYLKVRDRESYAFALASAAVALDLDGGTVRRAHIAMGGIGTRPWRAPEAERHLAGKPLTLELAQEAGRAAMAGARPGRFNRFKIDLGARTVADAIMTASRRAG